MEMKKLFYLLGLVVTVAVIVVACQKTTMNDNATNPESTLKAGNGCTTIQSGDLVDSQGDVITTGYNDFGYNYQAHMYNGDYGYEGWNLIMKWNDAWLSNKDCDGDGLLDRHLGYDSYIGSGAWETNHWTTTYELADGTTCHYDSFIKIVAVPEDATLTDGIWYSASGDEIGANIWGQFAIIQNVVNDPCSGIEGVQYKSPDHPGLGNW